MTTEFTYFYVSGSRTNVSPFQEQVQSLVFLFFFDNSFILHTKQWRKAEAKQAVVWTKCGKVGPFWITLVTWINSHKLHQLSATQRVKLGTSQKKSTLRAATEKAEDKKKKRNKYKWENWDLRRYNNHLTSIFLSQSNNQFQELHRSDKDIFVSFHGASPYSCWCKKKSPPRQLVFKKDSGKEKRSLHMPNV